MKEITEFRGEYRWLSNFWQAPIEVGGWIWPTNEHAYQAAKSLDPRDWKKIQERASPHYAKVDGRSVNMRPDWEEIKIEVMREIIHAKFDQHPDLHAKLMATKGMMLVEGNHWGDTFWGVCRGMGTNHLGRIIMEYRDSHYLQNNLENACG
ncbi:MAG: NADAR family protein [Mesorhizobium sp.]|uniref:NADAR family protein n=1 Tax=Mesorhizobium sp. TaxID=1871066 RepID=UPI000FE74AA8|nr:NADAR family protein [Mesorhizobium sp.]RWB40445.1 MAG: NADAR family protein [Mesorhizobium sp.]